jgi:hypothetical protein
MLRTLASRLGIVISCSLVLPVEIFAQILAKQKERSIDYFIPWRCGELFAGSDVNMTVVNSSFWEES